MNRQEFDKLEAEAADQSMRRWVLIFVIIMGLLSGMTACHRKKAHDVPTGNLITDTARVVSIDGYLEGDTMISYRDTTTMLIQHGDRWWVSAHDTVEMWRKGGAHPTPWRYNPTARTDTVAADSIEYMPVIVDTIRNGRMQP